jgi:adenylylsulfate kinase-like enzyme
MGIHILLIAGNEALISKGYIAGTLYSDIETGGFTMYTLDGDVISTHQGLNK